MAGSVNKVIIVGNLGRDPEVRRMIGRASAGIFLVGLGAVLLAM